MTGPKIGSRVMPTISSATPPLHHALDIEAGAERRQRIGRVAHGASSRRLSLTAPCSDLCGDAERLQRHGKAERRGGSDGLVGVGGAPPGGTGRPASASSALASASSGEVDPHSVSGFALDTSPRSTGRGKAVID